MRKRGSHVGVILSFVIFVTFLIFLYSVLEPVIKTQQNKQPIANSIIDILIENVSSNLTSFSLKIDDTVTSPGCFAIEINFIEGKNATVKNETNEIIDSYVFGDYLVVKRNYNKKFFKIYLSEDFEIGTPLTQCTTFSEDNYTLGLVKTDKYIFEDKLLALNGIDYETLKTKWNTPPNAEFSISFDNGIILTQINPIEPPTTDVYSEDVPIQYFNKTADIKTGFINIKVW